MKEKISIIIPFYNEEDNLKELDENLLKKINLLDSFKIELIFVNDGSKDLSLEKLKNINFKEYSAKVINLSKNFGSHSAVFAGITISTGDYITILSCDFQDDVSVILQMYERIKRGADIVFPLRKDNNSYSLSKFFSNIYASLMRKYAVKNFPNENFDLFFIKAKVREIIVETYEPNLSLFLHIMNLGFVQDFVYYDRLKRKNGKSKWTLSKKIKLLIDSFVGHSYAAIRFVSIVGFLLFIIGFFMSSIVVIRTLIYDDLISGWPTLISILLLGFGITNISLGIIAEYLWRTLDATRKKPVFIVDNVISLNKNDE